MGFAAMSQTSTQATVLQ